MTDSALETNSVFTVHNRNTDETVELEVDPMTRAQVFVDNEHHEIHAGDFFRISTVKDIPNAGTLALVITTPDTEKTIHFRVQCDVEGEALYQLYEGVTGISGGAAKTPRNAYRDVGDISTVVALIDPTYSIASATELDTDHLGSGNQKGGSLLESDEWILARNTSYVVLITNLTAVANYSSIRSVFYGHTPHFGLVP